MGSKSKKKNNPEVSGNRVFGRDNKVITDERFAQSQKDPRFQDVPRHKTKVAIDSRFSHMFTDKNFSTSSARVDKRGRPKKDDDSSQNALKHYYRMDNEEHKQKKQRQESKSETESSEEKSEEDCMDDYTSKHKSKEEEAYKEKNVPKTVKETHRLAVVNLDWSQVQAVDLFVSLSSCLPKRGEILSVSVYPSKIGLKKMKGEAVCGQNSLSYYFAVVVCDSVATADYLYMRCDGFEFERSSNILDLSFIPDSMEFKHHPRDVTTEALFFPESFKFDTDPVKKTESGSSKL